MIPIVFAALVSLLFLGPLGWRAWVDARRAEADVVGAGVRAAINRRLRGESLLAVSVIPPLFWRPGKIVVSVPSDYGWLVEAAWPALARETPSGYDVVLRTGSLAAAWSPETPPSSELRRAA